jgi:hypothetical protein
MREGEMVDGKEMEKLVKAVKWRQRRCFCFDTKLKRCAGHPGTRHMLRCTTSQSQKHLFAQNKTNQEVCECYSFLPLRFKPQSKQLCASVRSALVTPTK